MHNKKLWIFSGVFVLVLALVLTWYFTRKVNANLTNSGNTTIVDQSQINERQDNPYTLASAISNGIAQIISSSISKA